MGNKNSAQSSAVQPPQPPELPKEMGYDYVGPYLKTLSKGSR